ncbi:MAG: hypothetical protein E6G97_17830 [Alphaproteobacteria bacterium]|nr:MAG: hypothetical protein E6G97_17830 [Alphaproteobacteria bacterium]
MTGGATAMPEFDATVEYRDVPDEPGYMAGSDGSVWSSRMRGHWRQLHPPKDSHNYRQVKLSGRGYLVHRLVMRTFVGPCPAGQEVRHADADRSNNDLSNLSYGTPKQNACDKQVATRRQPRRKKRKQRQQERLDPSVTYRPVPDFPGYLAGDNGTIWSSHGQDGWRRLREANSKGYKRIGLCRHSRQVTDSVHAIILRVFVGPRPPDKQCCHRDGNKTNNRLENLYYGTAAENAADRATHGRTARGERGGNAKLVESQVVEIRERVAAGETHDDVAEAFGVSDSLVQLIANGRSWKHVGGPRTVVGAAKGERNGTATLTETQVREIRALAATGVRQTEICRRLGVRKGAVGHVVRGSRWKHLL